MTEIDPEINVPRLPPAPRAPLAIEVGDRSAKIGSLMTALAKVQARLKPAPRNAFNPFTGKKYADLSSIIGAAQAAGLGNEGLAVSQSFEQDPDRSDFLTCVTMLAQGESDQWITNRITMKLGGKGSTSPAQDVVAGSTYARRVGYQAIVGVVAEGDDEDGNEREQRERGERGERRAARPPARGAAGPGSTRGGSWVEPARGETRLDQSPPAANVHPENVVAAAASVARDEFQRQERVIHLMRELAPRGFKITKQVNSGRITLTLPRSVSLEGRSVLRFDELTLELMDKLERLLTDQLAVGTAGGRDPASAAPSSTPGSHPSRSDSGGRAATEESRGPRGDLFPADDDVPF